MLNMGPMNRRTTARQKQMDATLWHCDQCNSFVSIHSALIGGRSILSNLRRDLWSSAVLSLVFWGFSSLSVSSKTTPDWQAEWRQIAGSHFSRARAKECDSVSIE